jgi:hypothetical protein
MVEEAARKMIAESMRIVEFLGFEYCDYGNLPNPMKTERKNLGIVLSIHWP